MSLQNYSFRFTATEEAAESVFRYAKGVGLADLCLTPLYGQPPGDNQVMSIQVVATRHDDDIVVVPETSGDKTHFSVYTRGFDGLASHVADFKIKPAEGAEMARMEAMTLTASLSMKYQVPVEIIR